MICVLQALRQRRRDALALALESLAELHHRQNKDRHINQHQEHDGPGKPVLEYVNRDNSGQATEQDAPNRIRERSA